MQYQGITTEADLERKQEQTASLSEISIPNENSS
jgi:hypothetical protein